MNIINKILRLVKSLMVPVEAELPFFIYYRPKYDLLHPEYEEYKRSVNGFKYDDRN